MYINSSDLKIVYNNLHLIGNLPPTTNQPINKKKFKLFSFTTFKNLPYKMFKTSSVLQKKGLYRVFYANCRNKFKIVAFYIYFFYMHNDVYNFFFNFFFIVTKTLHI